MAKDEKGGAYISEAQSRTRGEWEDHKQTKAEDREARIKAREERTDEQQLARLDKLLGVGVGAVKERAKLIARIEARKQKKAPKTTEDKPEEDK